MTHADEIERRMAEIRKDPILSRRLDELRRGVTERATVAQRLERMRGDRLEELVRSRRRAVAFLAVREAWGEFEQTKEKR